MTEWAVWALAQADRIDPVRTRSFLRKVADQGEDSHMGDVRRAPSELSNLENAEPPWQPNEWYTRLHR